MAVITIVSIGEAGEATGTAFAYLFLSYHTLTPRMGTSRQIHRAVFRKELHDRIQIVPIECFEKLLDEGFDFQALYAALGLG